MDVLLLFPINNQQLTNELKKYKKLFNSFIYDLRFTITYYALRIHECRIVCFRLLYHDVNNPVCNRKRK